MRSTGVVIILILLGIAIWVAFDRNPAVEAASNAPLGGNPMTSQPTSIDSPGEEIPKSIPAGQASLKVEVKQLESPPKPETESPAPRSIPREMNRQAAASLEDLEIDRMVIPVLKVNTRVKSKPYAELTWDLSDLGQDIAFLEDVPGQETDNNLVFAGHVTVRNGGSGPFRYLFKLAPGDEIILHKGQLNYTYAVLEQQVVFPDDTAVLEDTQEPQVTLITCITWNEETLSYLRRLIIIAKLEKIEFDQNNFE
jgi:LPXTG-site transpeptidase (sortase) family protein